jgi:hypothetical protein
MQDQFVTNTAGGVKGDGGKHQPRLLFNSLPYTLEGVSRVLTYGAKKYSPENWRLVEESRYWDAFYRHLLSYAKGEECDTETGESHLHHALCCLMFLAEKQATSTRQKPENP